MIRKKHLFFLVFAIIFVVAISITAIVFYLKNTASVVYTGKEGCDGCKEIDITLTLYANHTLQQELVFVFPNKSNTTFIEKGTWDKENLNNVLVYVLHYTDSRNHKVTDYYKAEGNKFIYLDNQASPLNSLLDLTLSKSNFWFQF